MEDIAICAEACIPLSWVSSEMGFSFKVGYHPVWASWAAQEVKCQDGFGSVIGIGEQLGCYDPLALWSIFFWGGVLTKSYNAISILEFLLNNTS